MQPYEGLDFIVSFDEIKAYEMYIKNGKWRLSSGNYGSLGYDFNLWDQRLDSSARSVILIHFMKFLVLLVHNSVVSKTRMHFYLVFIAMGFLLLYSSITHSESFVSKTNMQFYLLQCKAFFTINLFISSSTSIRTQSLDLV